MIVDGVIPSNEGRGYVLRRIIRRAARHGNKLGAQTAFFYRLVAGLVQQMGDAYPELRNNQSRVEQTLQQEEERFNETLATGMKILEEAIGQLKSDVIPGDVVFKLYDTFGFPVDLTADIARERNLRVDEEGFETAMEAQRDRARSKQHFNASGNERVAVTVASEFVGYESLTDSTAVVALHADGQATEELQTGQSGMVGA